MRLSQPANRRLVEAVVSSFRSGKSVDPGAAFASFSETDWTDTALWLDASSMALYLLDHAERNQFANRIPPGALESMRRKRSHNIERQKKLLEECIALNDAFEANGISHLNLKGFTLIPHACPDAALRRQSDLDFLIARNHLLSARRCLEERGHILTAATPTTWEFKARSPVPSSADAAYTAGAYPSVEIHFHSDSAHGNEAVRDPRHAGWAQFNGRPFPALNEPAILIGQAKHILEHLRSERTRASWLLEFRHHVLLRGAQPEFWERTRQFAEEDRYAALALGVALQVTTNVFGTFAPPALERWAVRDVPPRVAAWAETFGARAVLADLPGTKLCVLLERELVAEGFAPRSAGSLRWMPALRPPPIFHHTTQRSPAEIFRRARMQLRFCAHRLRFHLTQGVICGVESLRWNRGLAAPQREEAAASCASALAMTRSDNPKTTA